KIKILSRLLHDAKPAEGKYLLRTVNGKLRLGVADMTILDALAIAFGSKEDRHLLEEAYNRSSDLGQVARAMVEGGVKSLKKIKMKVGVPLRPMLAERVPELSMIFEKMGESFAMEYKYDGLRIQAHIGRDGVKLFSRHMEDLTLQFPDVVEALADALMAKETIVEGECVPIGPGGDLRPFQEISQRRGRKHGLEKAQKDVPVAFFAFDCLYVDKKDLLGKTYPERRNALASALKETEKVKQSQMVTINSLEEADAFFEESIGAGCEGVMAKSLGPESTYKAGARGWQWIKYKMDYKTEMADTVDLVVVGAFAGKGRRAGAYGALLMAAYNPDVDRFETVCKLGTGFDDKTLFSLKERFTEQKKRHPRVDSDMKAEFWLVPELVMEVTGAEITLSPIHTCAKGSIREGSGLAIRFPRFTGRWRDDKGAEDATTVEEVVGMYKNQLKKVDG
ncbi:MAG: ATP-dependent DNA ligase, partial [Candidatus Thermoplasmatota archaeon]|nr:ATP-dependent DNA ligase [Candidatus Thermoplasmatota archaeon]